MRIALVHSRFDQFGGAERYLTALAAGYVEAGHQVSLFTTTPPPEGTWPAGAPVHLLPTPGPHALWAHPSPAGKVFRHLADASPVRPGPAAGVLQKPADVVHLHNWHHIGAGAVRAIAKQRPVVHTVHDFALVDPTTTLDSGTWSPAKTAALKARAAVVVPQFAGVHLHWPSSRTRELAATVTGAVRREPASVVPLSVPATNRLRELGPGDPHTFLLLGHLSAHKGVPDALEAWQAARRRPGARLLIAGDGPLRDDVRAAAAADDTIEYLGFLDADGARAALARAGWLLFPSTWHENFSISCVEALAAGRPILTSAVANPPMASPGSVVVFDTPARLTWELEGILRMGREAYTAAADSARADGQGMLWDVHVKTMIDLLQQVALGPSGAGGPAR
ncbi:glycosyltransferase family 4 protein [Spongisporangium articulatum]|uniref:Glycosyltransferase family 4 protein n=1 Tax=Spongisporangium articulatum TaxID=3362603 RepID=A0ABW8ANB2_9ACTN